MNRENKLSYLQKKQKELMFSGAFYGQKGNVILKGSNGFANLSEKLLTNWIQDFLLHPAVKFSHL